MRKIIILISSFVFAFTILISTNLFSYETSTLGLYKFESKILVFSISYDGGSTWTTVFDRESEGGALIDIAAGEIGNQMGSYCQGVVIPTGTITHSKVKIEMSCKIKGWIKSGATYYYTNPSGTNQTKSTASLATAQSSCAEITLGAPPGYSTSFEQTQAVSIVVEENSQINVSIVFNLNNQLQLLAAGPGGQPMIIPQDSSLSKPTITQI